MAFIEWKDSYSVGIQEIDSQHKHLLFIANHFLETVSGNLGNEDLFRVLDSTINELIDYTIYHFSTEEKILSLNNYPNLIEHRKEHRALINKAFNLSERLQESHTAVSVDDLAILLNQWLINHITQSDQTYGEYFKKENIDVI